LYLDSSANAALTKSLMNVSLVNQGNVQDFIRNDDSAFQSKTRVQTLANQSIEGSGIMTGSK
jgi:hypothetical protein